MVEINSEVLSVEMALRGWNQADLAARAKVCQQTVSRALAGRQLQALTAYKIGVALKESEPVSVPEGLIEKAS